MVRIDEFCVGRFAQDLLVVTLPGKPYRALVIRQGMPEKKAWVCHDLEEWVDKTRLIHRP
jgi:hypothetical protein